MFLINIRIQEIHFLVDLKISSIPIFNLIKEEKFEDIIFFKCFSLWSTNVLIINITNSHWKLLASMEGY